MTEQPQTGSKPDRGSSGDGKAPNGTLDTIRIEHVAGYPVPQSILRVDDAQRNEITEAALKDLGISTQLENGEKLKKITLACNAGPNDPSTFELEFFIVAEGRYGIFLGSDATDKLLAKRRGPAGLLGLVKRLRRGDLMN